jgi:hypothetical protein
MVYGHPQYCRIVYPFCLDPATFKNPVGSGKFGVLPLLWEVGFKALHKVPEASKYWFSQDNTQDIAADIQTFFGLITPLILHRHPVSEIYADNPADFRNILNAAETSPVFMVNSKGVNIVTTKGTDGWKGYDIKDPAKVLTWLESDLKSKDDPAALIYSAEHQSLPGKESGIQASDSCTPAKTYEVTM